MKNTLLKVLSLFLAFSTGCEKEVKNVRLPQFQQKLVITSFLSPADTVTTIYVTSNKSIYGEIDQQVTTGNLSGTISDGEKEIGLTQAEGGLEFRNEDLPVVEGKTYKITVNSDKGFSAEASCTVPVKRNLNIEADTTMITEDNPGYGKNYYVSSKIYLTDPPGEDNFYRFICKELIYDMGYYYYPEKLRLIGPEEELFSDEGRKGEKILVNTIIASDSPKSDSTFLVFYILHTDKPYYLFHRSLENYSGGDNPFSEISPVYSNVTGGLGIVAAFTVDSLVLRLN